VIEVINLEKTTGIAHPVLLAGIMVLASVFFIIASDILVAVGV